MANDEDIRRFTMDDIKAMRARGEDYSEDARLERMTDADIEAQAADEPEFHCTTAPVFGLPTT